MTKRKINEFKIKTSNNDGLNLNLAISYGSRQEIVNAINQLADKKLPPDIIKSIVYGAKEEDIVNSGLEDTMRIAFQEIKELKNLYKISSYRTAAYGIAIKKLEKSYLELGL